MWSQFRRHYNAGGGVGNNQGSGICAADTSEMSTPPQTHSPNQTIVDVLRDINKPFLDNLPQHPSPIDYDDYDDYDTNNILKAPRFMYDKIFCVDGVTCTQKNKFIQYVCDRVPGAVTRHISEDMTIVRRTKPTMTLKLMYKCLENLDSHRNEKMLFAGTPYFGYDWNAIWFGINQADSMCAVFNTLLAPSSKDYVVAATPIKSLRTALTTKQHPTTKKIYSEIVRVILFVDSNENRVAQRMSERNLARPSHYIVAQNLYYAHLWEMAPECYFIVDLGLFDGGGDGDTTASDMSAIHEAVFELVFNGWRRQSTAAAAAIQHQTITTMASMFISAPPLLRRRRRKQDRPTRTPPASSLMHARRRARQGVRLDRELNNDLYGSVDTDDDYDNSDDRYRKIVYKNVKKRRLFCD